MMMMTTQDSGTPSDSGTPMPSMVMASGSLTGTISAPVPIVGYDGAQSSSFTLTKTSGSGLKFTIDLSIAFDGMPMMMSYTSTSAGFGCTATIADGTTPADTWVALFNQPMQMNKGTCTLTFSKVTMGGSGYSTNGNFLITAENSGGAATGTVSIMGTF
jgi:hypothetical protein